LISTAPDPEVVGAFDTPGSEQKPRYGQMTVCWNQDEQAAKELALKMWANSAIPGQLGQELALPLYFEQASQLATPDKMAEQVVCGPDPAKYLAKIQEFTEAGFTHVYIHQVGPDQEGFFRFAEKEILPNVS
jgi:G6PDH family F420-dependent oxidoreductase